MLRQPPIELVFALRLDVLQLLYPFLASTIAETVEAVLGMRNEEEAEGADADFNLQTIVRMAAGVGKGRSEEGPEFELINDRHPIQKTHLRRNGSLTSLFTPSVGCV